MLKVEKLYKGRRHKNNPFVPLSFMTQNISKISASISEIQDQIIDYYMKPTLSIHSATEKMRQILLKLTGPVYRDILYHLPNAAISRNVVEDIDVDAHLDEIISVFCTIKSHNISWRKGAPSRIVVMAQGQDGPLELHIVYFRAAEDYIRKTYPLGSERIISGKLEQFDRYLQIVHPDFVVTKDRYGDLPNIQPLYGLTAGITQRTLGKIMAELVKSVPSAPEWIRTDILRQNNWLSLGQSLKAIHLPEASEDVDPQSIYRRRLAYDRILAHQLRLGMTRLEKKSGLKRAFSIKSHIAEKILKALPFDLTGDQKKVLEDIKTDLQDGAQLTRLVQGDVGSGKTLVALLAASYVIEDGAQAAIMAPTEILAKQHYASLKDICADAGIRIGLLTGKDKAKAARETLSQLAAGEIDLLIGTHALIQDRVIFKNLGLAIIDEQHRFGVEQRGKLADKGEPYAHILVMTATPIPRTLAMTHYGDTDLSIIREKPPGRKPIQTKVMPNEKLSAVANGLQRVIDAGERAYWVCPLVEESEKMDLIAAEDRYESLKALYPDQVGLVHGKMKTAEKDKIVKEFAAGELSILVATTVIEVGVNVPEATVIIIEEAERFGLSQLHQLRGRVGRGDKDASCVLLYKGPLNKYAQERLSTIRSTEDGFILAEKDLELRGAGDFLGTKQTGLLSLQGFDFEHHSDLIPVARDDV
ncbi:MAG: ATP-dependent DNA helicase RecG, partial [Pseudomonadota bacterium]